MARILGFIVALAVVLVIGVAVARSLQSGAGRAALNRAETAEVSATTGDTGRLRAVLAPDDSPACRGAATFSEAAARNGDSVLNWDWSPFGRREQGWRIYGPLVAHEVGAGCGPSSTVFAQRLAEWQQANGFPADGVLTQKQFDVMRIRWLKQMNVGHVRGATCADPADLSLATAAPDESYGGKTIEVAPGALAAYRAMVAAARREEPALAQDDQMLRIFSGFRSTAENAARCQDGGCGGPVRSSCSMHRTGRALDIVVGQAPGGRVDSSEDANRLAMSQTPVYRWLVANADRFGFVPYPFEPWHWEWASPQQLAERNRPPTP